LKISFRKKVDFGDFIRLLDDRNCDKNSGSLGDLKLESNEFTWGDELAEFK